MNSSRDTDPTAFEIHRATVEPGVEIAYVREGIGGVPLVLLHGWGATKRIFWRNIEPLARAGFEVIVPDARGFGDSALPSEISNGPTLVGMAYDLRALLEQLGHDKIIIGGGDLGGAATMEFSNHFPEMTIRQIIWNGPMPNIADAYTQAGITSSQVEEVLAVSTHIEEYGVRPDAFVASLPTPEDRIRYVESVYSQRVWKAGNDPIWFSHPDSFNAEQLRFMSEPFADEMRFRATLHSYEALLQPELNPHPSYMDRANEKTETLLLYGVDDGIIGPNFTYRGCVAFSRRVGPFLIDRCGHFVPWERPDVFNNAVICFCRDLLA